MGNGLVFSQHVTVRTTHSSHHISPMKQHIHDRHIENTAIVQRVSEYSLTPIKRPLTGKVAT